MLKIFGFEIGKAKPEKQAVSTRPVRRFYQYDIFDGEKNAGAVGPVKDYFLDTQVLRARSWQLYLESEICSMAINRLARWVIGKGLDLRSIPETSYLATEGIKLNSETFNNVVESRWQVFANSCTADYSNKRNLHELANDALVNGKVGGDVLVILRIINGSLRVQLIDGAHVSNPMSTGVAITGADFIYNGNIVRDGVEINSEGKPIAYHVKFEPFNWERIEAYNSKTGQKMAWLYSGNQFRLDDYRGLAMLATVIESAKTLDRYKEATVSSAEERAKIAYYIKHGTQSDEEDIFAKNATKISNYNDQDDVPVDKFGTMLAENIYATTNKQTFNMPRDTAIESLESKQELHFKDFFMTISNDIFSAVGIPPNVARMMYDSNFSASRAALKDWEHTLDVERKNFANGFYLPIYSVWLDIEVAKNKVQAQGYLRALMSKDYLTLEAFKASAWRGANVPHIDPVKEVTAERLKLGKMFEDKPLTTLENATINVNGGDSEDNMEQAAKEIEQAENLGLKYIEPIVVPINTNNNATN
jgi:capsid protein